MTDIVERLRDPATPIVMRPKPDPLRLEAADQIERLRAALIPPHVVREFMAHRHFWAAHEINIVARKDGKEYRLEGDWLKEACRALEPKP